MSVIAKILVTLVAAVSFTPPLKLLLKNQGVYNGLIGLGLLFGTYFSHSPIEIDVMLLIYIILVALYGSMTSDKTIILKQGGLAGIALLVILL